MERVLGVKGKHQPGTSRFHAWEPNLHGSRPGSGAERERKREREKRERARQGDRGEREERKPTKKVEEGDLNCLSCPNFSLLYPRSRGVAQGRWHCNSAILT